MEKKIASLADSLGMGRAWRHPLRPFILTFFAHLGAAQFAYHIYQGITPAIVWPSAGVALAALVVAGRGVWPAITIASLTNSLITGQPTIVALGIALASTLQAWGGALLLERLGFNTLMNRLYDTVVLVLVSLSMAFIGPMIISTSLLWGNLITPDIFLPTLGRWWLASATGLLIVGGFFIRWLSKLQLDPRTPLQWVEAAVALVAAILLTWVLSWTPVTSFAGVSLVYFLLLPFFWIALRVGPRAMTFALLLVTIISLGGATWGYAREFGALSERIIATELLFLVWSIIFLLLVSANEERKEALKAFTAQVLQLQDAIVRVRAEEETKTEFLAMLAHELRNPLAPVLSSIELLRLRGNDPAERNALLASIEERVKTMGRLLDDLLDISRITQKKLTLQKETVDMRHVVDVAVANTEGLIASRNHTLRQELPPNPLMVHVDPVRVEQIIVNLLTNAAKYTPPNGTITITLAAHQRGVSLSVRDTGMGIPPEMLEHIFETFVQLPHAQGNTSHGLGIGLSLTKRLVHLHEGSISARSSGVGKGAEFVVTLPKSALAQPLVPKPESETRVSAPRLGSLRILLVDDNEAAADTMGKLLSYKGHEVVLAYTAADALARAAEFRPHVGILDIGLPDMNGYELANHMKLLDAQIYLIALSGYGQDDDKKKAQEAGFDQHCTKPIGIDDLERALHNFVTK